MSVDDVWGEQTWRMNQSEVDTEPDSATKDKKRIMTKTGEKVKLQSWWTAASHYMGEYQRFSLLYC